MKLRSPVTGSEQVNFVRAFSTAKIIDQYREAGVSTDRFFTGLSSVELYECSDTGYRFYHPAHIFGDGRFYMELQGSGEGYYPEGKWEHRYSAALVRPHEKVLEVGSGDGIFLRLLQQKGVQAKGLELNLHAVSIARQQGLQMDDETIQAHALRCPQTYDVVCSFQVLEHIYDVREYLLACMAALKPSGKLILGVPNNNPYLYRYDDWHTLNLPPHHAGLWSRRAFEALPGFFNLKTERIIVEPLHSSRGEYGHWLRVQLAHYRERRPALYRLLSAVPRPVHKLAMRIFSSFIEGRNIVAVFKKI